MTTVSGLGSTVAQRIQSPDTNGESTERWRSFLVRWIRECVRLELHVDDEALNMYLYLCLISEETEWWTERDFETVRSIETNHSREISQTYRAFKTTDCRKMAHQYPVELCPLHVAVKMGSECCAKILLRHDWNGDEQCAYTEETALHEACVSRRPEMVKLLLENGARPNMINYRANTALNLAIMHKAHRCLDVLLNERVTISVSYTFFGLPMGNDAMTHAARENNVYALRKMMANYSFHELLGRGDEPFYSAARNCNPEALEALLDYATEQNELGHVRGAKRPLDFSGVIVSGMRFRPRSWCESKRIECLNLLLERGADANVPRHEYREGPPLCYAVNSVCGSEYCILLLKHTDLDVLKVDFRDELVLQTAAGGKTDVMRALYERNHDMVETQNIQLIAEAFFGSNVSAEMITFLLRVGVDVVRKVRKEAYDKFLNHPRNDAWSSVRVAVFKILLEAGAGRNLNEFLKVTYRWTYFPRRHLEVVADMLRKYTTQDHYNELIAKGLIDEMVLSTPRLPSLQQSCRSAVRSAVLSTGKYPSMRFVEAERLRLPETLQKYVMFSGGD